MTQTSRRLAQASRRLARIFERLAQATQRLAQASLRLAQASVSLAQASLRPAQASQSEPEDQVLVLGPAQRFDWATPMLAWSLRHWSMPLKELALAFQRMARTS